MCNNCPEITPCQPDTECVCNLFIKSDCVTEVTVDLPCSAITKGKPLNEVLIAFDAFVCGVIENFNGAYTTLKNIGSGAGKVYKGVSIVGEREIKSIKGTQYIDINNLTEEVEVAINVTALTTLIESTATGATNLAYVENLEYGTITSDTGTDAIIPLVTDVNAGLVSPDMWGLIQSVTSKQAIANQIEVTASTTVQSTWHGKTVVVSGALTFTVPVVTTFISGFTFEIITLDESSVTWVQTVPNSFLFGNPTQMLQQTIATFMRRGLTNKIMLLGQEIF